jgi:hypothetical protein
MSMYEAARINLGSWRGKTCLLLLPASNTENTLQFARPRGVDAARIARLRAQGLSWPQIAEEPDCSVGNAQSALALSKNPAPSPVAAG